MLKKGKENNKSLKSFTGGNWTGIKREEGKGMRSFGASVDSWKREGE